ncbi:MAG: Fic family protein [Arcicella sp.]|nr:Fic family protein [Arcicella sp.]
MLEDLKILPIHLLDEYKKNFPKDSKKAFENLKDAEISTDSFCFYISVSSVFSSKIEGEEIELDSYIKHKRFGIKFSPDYTKKIDDLYAAYSFAQNYSLSFENFSNVHKLISKHILVDYLQGIIRTQNMYVITKEGSIEYVAASPSIVQNEIDKLFYDINALLQSELTFEEVFFFASLIHLFFVKIHPWNDGNGRSARLLEKWFISSHLGEKSWFIQSEKNYYQQHKSYYNNIRKLGLEYSELDYSEALPFLLMLPNSLIMQ